MQSRHCGSLRERDTIVTEETFIPGREGSAANADTPDGGCCITYIIDGERETA